MLQPVIVRRPGAGDYQLVAGERRLRAAHLAGLDHDPGDRAATSTTAQMMELALIENIQREDLNPIDEARAYQALIEKVGLTHDQLSERVGKQRELDHELASPARASGRSHGHGFTWNIVRGHARALLGLESRGDQLAAARYVASQGFLGAPHRGVRAP